MMLSGILAQIDGEIEKLQQARQVLAPGATGKGGAAQRTGAKKKRNLTPEGRARIAAAVKRRWAAQKSKQK